MTFDSDGTTVAVTLSLRSGTRVTVHELEGRARLCVGFDDSTLMMFADPEPLRAFAESLLEHMDRLDRERVARNQLGLELEPQT